MDKKAYSELKNEQDTHWWFTARREIICAVIHQYIKELIKKRSSDIDILDAGCGMGVLLKRLSAYGRVYGMDAEMEAVEYCSDLLKMAGGGGTVLQGCLPDDIPFDEKTFDVIVLADCLEHMKEDGRALANLRKRLKNKESFLVLTVPALMSLWSYNDVFVHHERRYGRKQLISLCRKNGFHVQMCSYFNFWMFPAVWLVRKTKNLLHIDKDDLAYGVKAGPVNAVMTRIFASEKRRLLKKKRFPIGVSLILVASKGTKGGNGI